MYDFMIVGAGLFGATFADQCRRNGKTCIIIEKKERVGGHVWSEKMDGIDVHVTGPHIFNTDRQDIWDYANSFGAFNNYRHRVVAMYEDRPYSFPINLMTIAQVFGHTDLRVVKADCEEWHDPSESMETYCLVKFGRMLYERFFLGYTLKHWGRHPSQLPAFIAHRIPVRSTYKDDYHDTQFSGVPKCGYAAWMRNILYGQKIELGVDFTKHGAPGHAKHLIYTGPIDEYFHYEYGPLQYRTIVNDYVTYQKADIYGVAQINHTCNSVSHTRTIEHKHFRPDDELGLSSAVTVVTRERPVEFVVEGRPELDRYYPVPTAENIERHRKYKALAKQERNVTFAGRLGSFRYMDMAPTMLSAINTFRMLTS